MNRTLYAVADDVLALEELLFESGGELTPEIEAWMAENGEHLAAKIDGYGSLLKEWEGGAKILKDEEARLATRRKVLENSQARLKGWLNLNLERMGEKSVKGTYFTASRQKNGSRSFTVLATVDQLPPAFVHEETVRSVDVAALKALLPTAPEDSAFEVVIGGTAVARLEPATYSVRVR